MLTFTHDGLFLLEIFKFEYYSDQPFNANLMQIIRSNIYPCHQKFTPVITVSPKHLLTHQQTQGLTHLSLFYYCLAGPEGKLEMYVSQ